MNLYDLDTPALLVDLDRLEANLDRMAGIAKRGGKALRPHIKTHKTPELAKLQLAAGASGITCAKTAEAEVFAAAGFVDILIANQIVGESKLNRVADLNRESRVAIGFDSPEGVDAASSAAKRAGVVIPGLIEVDTGTGRAGVRSPEMATALAQRIANSPGLQFDGLFTHEAAYQSDFADREAACRQASHTMSLAKLAIEQSGIECEVMSFGSTPGAANLAHDPLVTELRPGNYVFLDVMQTGVASLLSECALFALASVISRPDDRTAIIDAGTKALSGDRGPTGSKHGVVLDDPAILFDWANEEHGHLDLANAAIQPKIGQKLRVIPWHACTCCNMHSTLFAVRGERVEAQWPISARGAFW